jgi:uncharacterized protein YkwD
VPRKLCPLFLTALALVIIAVPATAQARGYKAHRVAEAEISVGAERAMLASAKTAARAAAPAECANADLAPASDNLHLIRAAVICLHNEVRAKNGLSSLRGNSRLRRAAEAHAADMVSNRFFDHTTPRGATMVDRILRARYVRANQGWVLGENLEWGTGRLATPRGAIEAWMDSPGHRANLLKRGYRDIGVGIVLGVPSAIEGGATYTVDFGAKR